MPTFLFPPNPTQSPNEPEQETAADSAAAANRVKVRAGRFGEVEEHELIHLLDALDDDRARSRFRESIYISVIVYLALGWFLFYGPQVLFHQPRLVNPSDVMRARQKELTYLDLPPDVAKQLAHPPTDKIAEKPHTAQTVKPQIDRKTLEALRRSAPRPAPTPLPPTPQPQPQATQRPAPTPNPLPQQRPLPQAPQTAMVDAPRPQPHVNFGGPQTAGDAIRQAAQNSRAGGSGGSADYDHAGSHGGLNTGVDVLSDTEGVDFGPYITKILREIKQTWLPLIPEEARPPLNKQGVTQIRFSILPDGSIGGMTLEGSTHDDALNRAAWGGIRGVGQYPPLPSQFKGPNLELRIHFLVNQTSE